MSSVPWISGEEADAWFRALQALDADAVIRALTYLQDVRRTAPATALFEYDTDHNHAWYLLGLAYEAKGMLSTAAACFRVAAEIWPQDADAYVAFSNTEPDASAQVPFLEAGLTEVDDPRLRLNLANAYLDLGDPAKALGHLEAIPADCDFYDDVTVSMNEALARIQSREK